MDRFDIHHEQYLAEWVEANLRHLYEVCADYVPWVDAKSSSDEEELTHPGKSSDSRDS